MNRNSRKHDDFITFLIAVVILLLCLSVAMGSTEDIVAEGRVEYCEMVELWESTGGSYGWPPFQGPCEPPSP